MHFKSQTSKNGGEGLLACIWRINKGVQIHGRHPDEWGGTFGVFMSAMKVKSVEAVTGMRLTADNLLMMYMSLRESSGHIDSLENERSSLQTEVNRLWYEAQTGYRNGHVHVNTLERMMRQRGS